MVITKFVFIMVLLYDEGSSTIIHNYRKDTMVLFLYAL
jgi:hypothetical protein